MGIPAPLPEEQTAEVRRLAVRRLRGARPARAWSGWTSSSPRTARFVVNEINTMPGITPISMFPRMWEATGLPLPELVDRIIQTALRKRPGLR